MDSCKKLLLGVVATLSLFATATPVFAADASSLQYMSQAGKTSQVSHVDYTTNVSKSTSATQATQKATTSYTTQSTKSASMHLGFNAINQDPNQIKFLKSDGTLANGWCNNSGSGWYYFDSNNNMVRSKWIQDGSDWYYLKADGNMASDIVVDGYYVNKSGAWDKSVTDFSGKLTYKVARVTGMNSAIPISEFESLVSSGKIKVRVNYYSSTGSSGDTSKNIGTLDFFLAN